MSVPLRTAPQSLSLRSGQMPATVLGRAGLQFVDVVPLYSPWTFLGLATNAVYQMDETAQAPTVIARSWTDKWLLDHQDGETVGGRSGFIGRNILVQVEKKSNTTTQIEVNTKKAQTNGRHQSRRRFTSETTRHKNPLEPVRQGSR